MANFNAKHKEISDRIRANATESEKEEDSKNGDKSLEALKNKIANMYPRCTLQYDDDGNIIKYNFAA